MFLPNVIKIERYNFELYRFKFVHFWRHSEHSVYRKSLRGLREKANKLRVSEADGKKQRKEEASGWEQEALGRKRRQMTVSSYKTSICHSGMPSLQSLATRNVFYTLVRMLTNSSVDGSSSLSSWVYCGDVKRGQTFEAEAEDKSSRPRPRKNFWGQGQGRGQIFDAEAEDNFPSPVHR